MQERLGRIIRGAYTPCTNLGPTLNTLHNMRIESLTFFRFVAALMVVFFHFGGDIGLPTALLAGQQMVTFFFVLSGFVMVVAYYRRDHIDLKAYWWARVARIFPVYFVALMMMVVFHWVRHSDFEPLAILLNVFFLQAWISPYPLSVNSPGWSLSVEMFFYLLFPLLVVLIKRWRVQPLLVLAVAFGTWLLTQGLSIAALNLGWYQGYPSLSHDLMFYFPLTHLCSFLLGVAAGVWFLSRKTDSLSDWISLPLIALSAFIIGYMLQNAALIQWQIGLKLPFESSFLAPFFGLFIVSMALCHSRLISVFSLRPLVLLGEASYSLYILQIPLRHVYWAGMTPFGEIDPVAKFIGLVLFLIAVSIMSFLYFEKPANRYLRYTFPAVVRNRPAGMAKRFR